MNTIKKLLVATVSSIFVFASATAGELSLSGAIELSSNSRANTNEGNKLGWENEYTISGSTELDNGIGVAYKMTTSDSFTESDTDITFTTDYGTIGVGNMYDGVDAVDNIVPTAHEEAEHNLGTWGDAGTLGASAGIKYVPNVDLYGMGATLFYTPKWGTAKTATDSAGSGDTGAEDNGSGYSIILAGNPGNFVDGLGVTVGYEKADQRGNAGKTGPQTDAESVTAAISYAYGPVTVGVQKGYRDEGYEGAVSVSATQGVHYRNTNYGIAYAINDALTVSYQRSDSNQKLADGRNVVQEADGYSAAYTMGGMTLSYYNNSVDNANYTVANTQDNSGVILSVAF